MISTTADLNRFYDALLDGDLFSTESLAAMRDSVATGQPEIYARYGLALGVTELDCGVTLWGHTGALPGFATQVTRADDGRQLSLSVNPLTQRLSRDAVASLYESVYCDSDLREPMEMVAGAERFILDDSVQRSHLGPPNGRGLCNTSPLRRGKVRGRWSRAGTKRGRSAGS